MTAFAHQNQEELYWWLSKIQGAKSILEIGSAHGHTLSMMARFSVANSKIRTIDMGLDMDGLGNAVMGLLKAGHDADLFFGDSTSKEAVEWARKNGPYDVVFIDGGHDFPVCRLDWENYGPMGKIVGFHDIHHPHHDVRHLWEEIKKTHKTDELAVSYMGIGVVYQ